VHDSVISMLLMETSIQWTTEVDCCKFSGIVRLV